MHIGREALMVMDENPCAASRYFVIVSPIVTSSSRSMPSRVGCGLETVDLASRETRRLVGHNPRGQGRVLGAVLGERVAREHLRVVPPKVGARSSFVSCAVPPRTIASHAAFVEDLGDARR